MLCLMFVIHFARTLSLSLFDYPSGSMHKPSLSHSVRFSNTHNKNGAYALSAHCVRVFSFRLSYFDWATFLTIRYQIACFFSFIAAM